MSGNVSGNSALTVIEAITQFFNGTQASWNSITVPIPSGLLVYATDTTNIKIGDGVTLYANLPTSVNLATLIADYSSVSSAGTSITTLNTEITSINTTLTTLSSEYTTLNTSVTSLTSSVSAVNTELGGINATLSTATGNISALTTEYTALNTTVSALTNAQMSYYFTYYSGTAIVAPGLGSTNTLATQTITFPAYSNTGNFRVLVNLTSGYNANSGSSFATNIQNVISDGINVILPGATWLVNSPGSLPWEIRDTLIPSVTYTPGSVVTFTHKVEIGTWGVAPLYIDVGYLEIFVMEA